MFTDFFFLLRFYGVPVTVTEWLALMRGLAMGLVPTGLDQFYAVARSILVKSEAYFDQYTRRSRTCSRASRPRWRSTTRSGTGSPTR